VLFEVFQSIHADPPEKAQQQQEAGPPINIEIPSLTPQQQQAEDRAFRISDFLIKVPPALNLPVGIVQIPYLLARHIEREWVPRGLLFTTWRALSWPIVGVFFWWLAGRGVDALLAARKAVLAPRITIGETVFAAIFLCLGVVTMVGIITSTPDDRRDSQFLVLTFGALLWGVIGAFTIAARFLQWRITKRVVVPVLT